MPLRAILHPDGRVPVLEPGTEADYAEAEVALIRFVQALARHEARLDFEAEIARRRVGGATPAD